MYGVLLSLYLIVAIALIGFILLQHGKGASMGASFGAGASNTVFGSVGSGNFLTHSTAVLATLFFIISLAISAMYAHQNKDTDKVDFENLQEAAEQMEVPSDKVNNDSSLQVPADKKVSEVKAAAEEKVEETKAAVEDKAAEIKAAAEEKVEETKAAVEDKAAEVKAAAEEKVEETKAAVEDKTAEVKAAAEEKVSEVKAAVEKTEEAQANAEQQIKQVQEAAK